MKMGTARVQAVHGRGAPVQPKEGAWVGGECGGQDVGSSLASSGEGGSFYWPGWLAFL